MITVFGISMPLFEILFLFMILLLVALIFVIIELKKLTYFLKFEQKEVDRFERDVDNLEKKEETTKSDIEQPYTMEKNINNPEPSKSNDLQPPRF